MSNFKSLDFSEENLGRREFLRYLAGTALCSAWGIGLALGQEKPAAGETSPNSGALIPRQKNPDNLEFPFTTLDSFITPNEKFYVRNHFAQPRLEADSWRLKVEGAVHRELELKLDDIRNLPARTVTATLECAGNGRASLVPKVKGVPWQLGAVGNAEWTGVPLAAVLERAGLRDSAVEVVLEGADSGEIMADIKPDGAVHFARSLPLAKARAPEVILAYEMNGADLPPAHGFPLRAVVTGWYGMASIKWLHRLVVTDQPFNGYFQSIDYSYLIREKGLCRVVPLTEMQVKSQIARPSVDEIIPPDTDYRIHGAAWTGESEVAKVELSTDGGKSWEEVRQFSEEKPSKGDIRSYSWRLWSYDWHTPKKPGGVRIMARATDRKDRVQPLERDLDRRNYMISHVRPVDVVVR
jgi:DMSO/TMAO reductase YedYZ molybdopterin-dependent catalytic subunit